MNAKIAIFTGEIEYLNGLSTIYTRKTMFTLFLRYTLKVIILLQMNKSTLNLFTWHINLVIGAFLALLVRWNGA
jgi:hypothetical protein